MNKKLFNDKLMKQIIDKMPILIFIVVVAAYCFMNINDFTGTPNVMKGGGFRQFGGGARYPPGTPFLYQMRYLVYFLFIFLVIFNLYYAYQSYLVKNISFYETGKAFLTSFGKRSQDISNKLYKLKDPEAVEYSQFVTACGVDYEPYTKLFCNMFSPCSCCGIGDYGPNSTLDDETKKKYKVVCEGAPLIDI